ncbi:MAG: hypothetical protein R2855_11930 [Thermomicrobiales bacterium]
MAIRLVPLGKRLCNHRSVCPAAMAFGRQGETLSNNPATLESAIPYLSNDHCRIPPKTTAKNRTGDERLSASITGLHLRFDIDHCGDCFRSCPRTSGGIVCDHGVCHDINNDADYCGFLGETCAPGQICRFGDCVNS